MSLLRSARFPAIVLLLAAALGLIVANSPLAPAVDDAMHAYLGIPGVFELSVSHWIKDGLLAVFFFVVAVELQFELTNGQLNSARKAMQPAIAAAGGVLVPIAIYLAMAAGSDATAGWPIPTATDIAFALGVLAVFGKGLPPALRVFLLALAILDDIVGIVFIAVLFTSGVDVGALALAAVAAVLFGVLSRMLGPRRYRDPEYAKSIAAEIYGGSLRDKPELAKVLLDSHSPIGSRRGYMLQLLAASGWTSLPFLRLIRQPTLILAGTDDPIIPMVNARIMASLLPNAELHTYDDGHLGLVVKADELAPRIAQFLR